MELLKKWSYRLGCIQLVMLVTGLIVVSSFAGVPEHKVWLTVGACFITASVDAVIALFGLWIGDGGHPYGIRRHESGLVFNLALANTFGMFVLAAPLIFQEAPSEARVWVVLFGAVMAAFLARFLWRATEIEFGSALFPRWRRIVEAFPIIGIFFTVA